MKAMLGVRPPAKGTGPQMKEGGCTLVCLRPPGKGFIQMAVPVTLRKSTAVKEIQSFITSATNSIVYFMYHTTFSLDYELLMELFSLDFLVLTLHLLTLELNWGLF